MSKKYRNGNKCGYFGLNNTFIIINLPSNFVIHQQKQILFKNDIKIPPSDRLLQREGKLFEFLGLLIDFETERNKSNKLAKPNKWAQFFENEHLFFNSNATTLQ